MNSFRSNEQSIFSKWVKQSARKEFMQVALEDLHKQRQRKWFFSLLSPPYPFKIAIQFLLLAWFFFIFKYLPIPFISDFLSLGIIPRNIQSLSGVVLAPLIHADVYHLLSNHTIFFQLLFLSILLPHREWAVIGILTLSTGIAVWIFAMQGNHVGASGLIYSLQGFNLVIAFYKRYWLLGGIIFVWFFLNNSFWEGIFGWFNFTYSNISYSSHIWGLISGVLCGIIIAKYFIPNSIVRHPDNPPNLTSQN